MLKVIKEYNFYHGKPIEIPNGPYEIVNLHIKNDCPVVSILHMEESSTEERQEINIALFRSGNDIPLRYKYLASFVDSYDWSWHICQVF